MTLSNPSHGAFHLFLLQQEWAYEQAGQFFWKRHIDAALDQIILSLAGVGFFPTRAWFRKCEEVVRGQGAGDGVSKFLNPNVPIEGFEKRAYQIRTADLADLPALLALEEACWSDGLRAHADELVSRASPATRRGSWRSSWKGRLSAQSIRSASWTSRRCCRAIFAT